MSFISLLLLTTLLLLYTTTATATTIQLNNDVTQQQQKNKYVVGGYFPSWGPYQACNSTTVADFDPSPYTHVWYVGFVGVVVFVIIVCCGFSVV